MPLFNVAFVALGGAAFFGMAVFAGFLMGGVFGQFDFGGLALMTGFATEFVGVTFVVEGDDAFAIVGVNVGGESRCGGESGKHDKNQQFFHGAKASLKGVRMLDGVKFINLINLCQGKFTNDSYVRPINNKNLSHACSLY